MSLLKTLSTEVDVFDSLGSSCLSELKQETSSILSDLRDLESELLRQCESEASGTGGADKDVATTSIDKETSKWYKHSMTSMKTYNSLINKFQKNIVGNLKFALSLDDAYSYPLHLTDDSLSRAIATHLLKTCLSTDVVRRLFVGKEALLKPNVLDNFEELRSIVDDILVHHKLDGAIQWLSKPPKATNHNLFEETNFNTMLAKMYLKSLELEFKFHILQYALLLNHTPSDGSDCGSIALEAYTYLRGQSAKFVVPYFEDFKSLILLLCCKPEIDQHGDGEKPNIEGLHKMMLDSITGREDYRRRSLAPLMASSASSSRSQSLFLKRILTSFNSIHSDQSLYVTLANDFISEYCSDMKLLNDSSLFQSILAGFYSLPNFHKYQKILQRLKKPEPVLDGKTKMSTCSHHGDDDDGLSSDEDAPDVSSPSTPPSSNSSTAEPSPNNGAYNQSAPYSFELPFPLPDSGTNLFNFHPIFICPVSKEQLIPITNFESPDAIERKRKRSFPGNLRSPTIIQNNGNSTITNNSRIIINLLSPMSSMATPAIYLRTMVLDKSNQVVVLKYCQHLALRDSILQLSKNGTDVFKCHYCYKKHKVTDISNAYFIDL